MEINFDLLVKKKKGKKEQAQKLWKEFVFYIIFQNMKHKSKNQFSKKDNEK